LLISSFFVGVEVRVTLKKTKSNRNKSFTCFLHISSSSWVVFLQQNLPGFHQQQES